MRSMATCSVRYSKSKIRGQKHPREVVKSKMRISSIAFICLGYYDCWQYHRNNGRRCMLWYRKCEKLLMVNCGITIPPNVTPLQLSLKYLILNNNHIRSFPVNYFEGLGLKHLQVKDNLLASVPHINELAPSLWILSLSGNFISTIAGLWINVTYHRLQSIHLSWNMISTVKVKIPTTRLIILDLRNNNISSMDDPKSQGLNVKLGSNPLHCNAAMAWAAQTGMSDPDTRCASPSCAAGRVLSELGRGIQITGYFLMYLTKMGTARSPCNSILALLPGSTTNNDTDEPFWVDYLECSHSLIQEASLLQLIENDQNLYDATHVTENVSRNFCWSHSKTLCKKFNLLWDFIPI